MMRTLVRRRQSAQTMAVMAVVIVAIVGTLAFVIDLGFQMQTRRQLQNAADAGALAGVVLLPDDQLGAVKQAIGARPTIGTDWQKAVAYRGANADITDRLCGTPTSQLPDYPSVTAPTEHSNVFSMARPGFDSTRGAYTLTVTMECYTDFSFGRILGLTQAPIRASATAAIGSPSYVGCTLPLWLFDGDGNPGNGIQNPNLPPPASGTYSVGQFFALYGKRGFTGGNAGTLDVWDTSHNNWSTNLKDMATAVSGNCNGPVVIKSDCSGVQAPCAGADPGADWHKGNGFSPTAPNWPTPPPSTFPNGRLVDCSDQPSAPYCNTTINPIVLPDGTTTSILPTPNQDATYSCAQDVSEVVNSDGTVVDDKANSPCLAVVPITSTVVTTGNPDIHIEGYAMVFLAAFRDSGDDPLLVVQFVKNVQIQGDLGAYNSLGSFVVALID